MKKYFVLMVAFLMVISFAACAQTTAATEAAPAAEEPAAEVPMEEEAAAAEPEAVIDNPVIRLSTTTSVNDSGLLPYLQPFFEEDTGYQLEVTSAGTGAAIEKARNGDADCLLVHAKASEEEYCNEGYGEVRVPFMYNYFVIVGPESDPAGVANTTTASEAFQAIADTGSTFITRGDDSGTNKAELKIWDAAGIDPSGQDWYVSIGAGMGQALTTADEMQAYTLSDKATFLASENGLSILLEKSDEMKNTYSMIAVTPARWPDTNFDGAEAFIAWMTTEKALDLIDEYGVEDYGEQLFFSIR
ncbi:MAG: tungstate transport system substrate-binding protein [Chloroflexota bacterium]|nr:tungstate transport system substrate-binding protein [Chloroflexota bacterium]